jgi:acyl-CoA dehydrogenase
MREAFKAGRFSTAPGADRGAAAVAAGVISADELTLLRRTGELADRVIRVDDFAQDLGASELKPAAASAPGSTTSRKIAAA